MARTIFSTQPQNILALLQRCSQNCRGNSSDWRAQSSFGCESPFRLAVDQIRRYNNPRGKSRNQCPGFPAKHRRSQIRNDFFWRTSGALQILMIASGTLARKHKYTKSKS